jgi:hypothetical protein
VLLGDVRLGCELMKRMHGGPPEELDVNSAERETGWLRAAFSGLQLGCRAV